jgi:hypothetical protein
VRVSAGRGAHRAAQLERGAWKLPNLCDVRAAVEFTKLGDAMSAADLFAEERRNHPETVLGIACSSAEKEER